MKMLLAVDGSDYTIRAIQYLITHFDLFKEMPDLHLLHVKTPIPDGVIRSMVGHAEIEAYYKDESQAALTPAENLLRESGVPFKSAYTVGNIAGQISDYVDQHKIDMIVMGSHGHGHFKKLVLGSVATAVIGTVHVPVLLIR